MRMRDSKTGRFARADKESYGTYVDEKGYLRISAGKHRGVRVATLVAEAMLGRKLRKDEEVHHKNSDKKDCEWTNLQVLGKAEHGAVSAKQAHFFRMNDIKAKKEWEEFPFEESTSFDPSTF